MGVELAPRRLPSELANPAVSFTQPVDINLFQRVMGHPGENALRINAKHHGVALKGKLEPCEPCAESKSRQKDVSKSLVPRSKQKSERIFLDGTSVKHTSVGGSKHWVVALDDATNKLWSFFMKNKDGQVDLLLDHFKDLKAKGTPVKFVRCDNAGENKSLEKACL